MKIAVPLYSVPRRNKITSLIKYDYLFGMIKEKLKIVVSVILIIDVYRNYEYHQYLGLTAHF